MADYAVRDRVPELWRQIDNTHFTYLETDDSPEKLDQKKKLEGYILDYLCLVPHESKFFLCETGEALSRSLAAPGGSGYRLARAWAALARYAANLLAQPWRKEYRTIKLYCGFYKHEVEGCGLVGGAGLLRRMGYRFCSPQGQPHCMALDGPVCPDRVAAVSRDSLIALVECQIMTQIWEEISLRGSSCSWLDVLRCRETCAGDIKQCVLAILHPQLSQPQDIYCNVKYPVASPESSIKQNIIQHHTQPPINGHTISNHVAQVPNNHVTHAQHPNNHITHVQHPNIQNGHVMPIKSHSVPEYQYCVNANQQMCNPPITSMHRPLEMNPMYGYNPVMNHYTGIPGYYYNSMPQHPYIMQPPVPQFGLVRQATTMPIANGYHCQSLPQQNYCPTVPTGQLIELDVQPNYSSSKYPAAVSPKHAERDGKGRDTSSRSSNANHSKKTQDVSCENQENIRRNSAPRPSAANSNDHGNHVISRSDTQPSLSKAREDGMGTFESWDYVFRNLESQGYSKDLGERGNILSPPLERDSKTLGRIGGGNLKRYQQTTMDLEDALHAMSLEKNSDDEIYRTAKINETLMKIKQETEAKAAKAVMKRQILADERDKRKSSSYDNSSTNPNTDANLNFNSTDKTRLISKEEAKDKKEMDKGVYMNGNAAVKACSDPRKVKKSVVKCLSSETEKNPRRKISAENSVQSTAAPRKTQVNHAPVSSSKSQPSQQNPSSAPSQHAAQSQHITQSLHNSQPSQNQPLSVDCTDQGLKTRLVVTLQDSEPKKPPTDGRWECGTCTYINPTGKKACEMCGKSRKAGSETLPLASGGRECPACTLVNPRSAASCGACDTSLEHSPTYI